MNVLLTGATGFLGGSLFRAFQQYKRYNVSVSVRLKVSGCDSEFVVGDISNLTNWSYFLRNIDVVIHAAGVNVAPKSKSINAFDEIRLVNTLGTLNLARQAVEAGVKRFIFISSIKVNGNETPINEPFSVHDLPAPADIYGVSKLEAEKGLMQIAAETDLEVVIIRPPLVYGPGVKGNFANIIRLVEKGVPLPLGAIHNLRSLVGIDNLVDLIIRCIDHPAAANEIFLAGDGEDLSTTQLLRGVACAMGLPSRLISVPASLLEGGAILLGQRSFAQRLLSSLQVDISNTCELLDWQPPFTVDEGLKRCFAKPD